MLRHGGFQGGHERLHGEAEGGIQRSLILMFLQWDIVLVHVLLGILLFILINWIGRHSYSIGYMEVSLLVKEEESPAFNFVFRILSPVVYLFLTSAILYSLSLDRYVSDIYLVSLYYIIFRLTFNLITNRVLLLNWGRQFVYWAGILALSYFSYLKLISVRENIFPDFKSFANELWIIILVFLYQTMNNLRFSSAQTERRKENHLKSRYRILQSRFGQHIERLAPNRKLQALIYAIIVYEDFNRPKIVRGVENVVFRITKRPMSLGIMQVRTDKLISDLQSVELGIQKILRAKQDSEARVHRAIEDGSSDESHWTLQYTITRDILKDYNPDDGYINEVASLAEIIEAKIHPSDGHHLASYDLIARLKDI